MVGAVISQAVTGTGPPGSLPCPPLRDYAGVYESPVLGTMTWRVTAAGGTFTRVEADGGSRRR